MERFAVKFFIILTSIFLAGEIKAQVFNAGVGGGLNVSQVDGDGFSGYNKVGPAVGVFVNTFFSEFLAGQIEINYSAKGSRFRTTIEEPRYYRLALHYVEIPVLIKYCALSEIIIEAGLSGGYLFLAREEDEFGQMPDTRDFRKTEFGAHMGTAYLFTDNISLGVRISYSIIPVRKHAGGGTYYFNRGQNNNVVSFTLHYQF